MNQQTALEQALQLSDDILSVIKAGEWDRLEALDKQRSSLIDQYYTGTKLIDADLTRQLRQKNDAIVSFLQELQRNVQSEQLNLQQSRKATKAYHNNT